LVAVYLVNLVPSVPFVIMTMTPFIEQINPSIESAAKMCGARMKDIFIRILGPLLIPGILAAGILVLVRTVGMFELTFLVSGPGSDTLVVAIYRAMTAAGGGEARQLVSAMAVVYTVSMLVILVIALRFVNPTQLVAQVGDSRLDERGQTGSRHVAKEPRMTASPTGGSRTSHHPQRIAVTGGAAGIGGAVAALLAEHGCTVYAIDVDPRGPSDPHGPSDVPPGPDAPPRLGRIVPLQADVTDESAMAAAFEQIAAEGGLDGLVTAAGIQTYGTVDETSTAVYDKTMAVNVHGAFRACHL